MSNNNLNIFHEDADYRLQKKVSADHADLVFLRLSQICDTLTEMERAETRPPISVAAKLTRKQSAHQKLFSDRSGSSL